MQRVWLIRAGEGDEQIDPMRHAGLIGLRYEEVGDATALTAAEIEQALIDANRPSPTKHRDRLRSFVNDITHGDLVVTPNSHRHEVWLSVITGSYQFDENPRIAGYSHTRTVDWLGWLDRDAAFMKDQLKVIEQPTTLAELYNREWWWKQLDLKEPSPQPRTSWSKAAPSRSRAPSATKRTSTAKPKAPPKPKPAVPLLCAGQCGLQWSPYVLVDGLCPDCRGD
jgi:predicted Mrr-cat superfamily restriction endonuclease